MSFGIHCAHIVDELRGPRPRRTVRGGQRPAVGIRPRCSPAAHHATAVTGSAR